MGDSGVGEDGMAATSKVESEMRDGTPSSIESTPDQEAPPEASQEQPAQPQKRKGGRKPIYATSEERKQRNRQAQAAFRERRTEYIKQLEATIKQNEETLGSLQQSHRSAADECLMLRYKNSLLERILLEKGIDVQAELQMKTGSPILGHGFLPPGSQVPQQQPPAQAPLQRAAIQRQHARRSGGQAFLPKLAPGQTNQNMSYAQSSPQGHPTPSSHASSPTNVSTTSPLTMHQGGITPPTSAVLAQGQAQQYQNAYPRSSQQPPNQNYYAPQQASNLQQQQRTMQRPPPPSHYQSGNSVVSSHSTGSQHSLNSPMPAGASAAPPSAGPSSASAYYPSPFQKHIDQLEQEYDTLEHQDQDANEGGSDPSPTQLHGSYPPQFDGQQSHSQEYYNQQQAYQQPPTQQAQYAPPQQQHQQPQQQPRQGNAGAPFAMGPQSIDPNDPMLDADPFGLSASMHYPTTYSAMDHQHSIQR